MFEYWFMFFIAIIVATIAMTLGVGGALFFSPIFILFFPIIGVSLLSPADAFFVALITEVFGFTSGLIGYSRKKLIDYKTALSLLIITIPLAVLGTFVKRQISQTEILNILFGAGLLILAIYIIKNIKSEGEGPPIASSSSPKRIIIDVDNNTYEFLVCNQNQGRILSGIGGFVTGLISVGVGETVVSTLRIRCGLPMRVATGTSVLVVTITVLVAALADLLFVGLEQIPSNVFDVVLFTVPGVLIGGQIGPRIASKVSSQTAEKFLILIFLVFGGIMLLKGILG